MDNELVKNIIFAFIGGIIPAAVWLWFWLKEDHKHPEPFRLIISTCLAGGVAVFLAYYLEQKVGNINISIFESFPLSWPWDKSEAIFVGGAILTLFGWALIEEFSKFLAALFISLRSKYLDEPVDAMIYMIASAIGFAAVENSLFLFKSLHILQDRYDFLLTGNLRFLGATLLHIFSSALIGAVIGLSFYTKGFKRAFYIILGIISSSLLHAAFNFFIIVDSGNYVFKMLLVLWALIVGILIIFEKLKNNNYK